MQRDALVLPDEQASALRDSDTHSEIPGVDRPLRIADFNSTPELPLQTVRAAELSPDRATSLFAHPAWLKADRAGELVTIQTRTQSSQLVFEIRHGHALHRGRLLWFEAACIALIRDRLLMLNGVEFVVFEDVIIEGELSFRASQFAFKYQNNWQIVLNGPRQPDQLDKKLAGTLARRLRNVRRAYGAARLGFHAAPSVIFLETIIDYSRSKIEARGRRYDVDHMEFERLRAVAADAGFASVLQDGKKIIAGDLICITGSRAYLMLGGYDRAFKRFSPRLITIKHAIYECQRRGVLDFNFLWGDGFYKQRLGGRRQPLITLVAGKGCSAFLQPRYLKTLLRFGRLHIKRSLKSLLVRWNLLKSEHDLFRSRGKQVP